MRTSAWFVLGLTLAACEGPTGPAGPRGPEGPAATVPDALPAAVTPACTTGCATDGLAVTLEVSPPPARGFFAAGDRPELIIRIRNRAGQLLAPSVLGTASLFVAGPRDALATRAAVKLLNCVTDRAAPDRQHHAIYLASPHYADPAQPNLTSDADGTLRYKLAAISDEESGTYSAGIWAKSSDEIDQTFVVTDFQIGTATAQTDATGTPSNSTCANCHQGPLSGKIYMAHILPGFSPFGNYALDALPISGCKSCHNADGYSANPLVRKVHGVHRGEHLLNPGAAHDDYGFGTDRTLAEFTNVAFPSFPGGERDCASCHVDDRWKSKPSRQACGSCHDNVFFSSGTLAPVRVLGQPTAGKCVQDSDCTGLLGVCNSATGQCERRNHPVQTSDAQCATCHSADATGLVPTARVHEITQRTRTRGISVTEAALSGASGPNGSFRVGDTISLTFKLTDAGGAVVSDLKTNSTLAANALVAGPTDAPQRVIGNPVALKTQGTLDFDAAAGRYTYTFPSPIPAGALTPLNGDAAQTRTTNPAGTYALWLYVNETFTVNGAQVRGAGNAILSFALGADQPIRPREVITRAACDSCHSVTQAHGGSRQAADGCWTCHNAGALDRGIGALGVACKSDEQCPGFAAGWELCKDTNNDATVDTCVATADPTPGVSINFPIMIHSIHGARVRAGYAERNHLENPGELQYVGFRNSLVNLKEVLFPQDLRNCTTCHADTAATCSTTKPCGIGQTCTAGVCRNTAWTSEVSTALCVSCHDSAQAAGHAALQTFTDPISGKSIETCAVCHGPNGDFAVAKVHDIAHPYVPPYPRSKE